MYLNKTQLIERGWSAKLIKQFLGKADDVHRLGFYCYEHLYFLPRVENVERREDFIAAQEKYLERRTRGKELAKRQAAQRIETAKTMPIRVVRLPDSEVLTDAIDYYNRRQRRRDWDNDDDWREFSPADEDSGQGFLERITVNYIRHNLTSYDSKLIAQKGKIGGNDAAPIIRRRVFEEIAVAYPQLADECDCQMIKRGLKSESELLPKICDKQLELPF